MRFFVVLCLGLMPILSAQASDSLRCKTVAKVLSIDSKDVAGKKELTLSLQAISAKSDNNRHQDSSCLRKPGEVAPFEPDNDAEVLAAGVAVGDTIEIAEEINTSEAGDEFVTHEVKTFLSVQKETSTPAGKETTSAAAGSAPSKPQKGGSCQINPAGDSSLLSLVGLAALLRARKPRG